MGAGTAAAATKFAGLARAIVLEDPPWRDSLPVGGEERRTQAERWREGIVANQALTREALMAKCRLEAPTWSDAEIGPWADAKLQVSPQVTEIITAPAPPWEETAGQIRCPTLLLRADVERGAIVSAATAQRARALCRHLRDVHIAGAGHSIRREQFGAYIAAVRAFLEEL
jgi:pimeloyl-ACP methyl ester carboxylesterase